MAYTLTITIDIYLLIIACSALLVFGHFYNKWVEHLERHGHDRGYMAFIVSVGCAITIAAFALATDLLLAIPLLAAFAASGIPMIWGSITRHVQARDAADDTRDTFALDRIEDK